MSSRTLPIFRRVLLAGVLGLTLAACGGTKTADTGGRITKIKYYHLDNFWKPIVVADPSIAFERDHHLRGAISNTERLERQGHYYVVMWKVTDRNQPARVRMEEYRQQKTGLAVKTQEQEIANAGRNNTTHFQVIGKEYVDNGPVIAWRAQLLRGKQVLAEEKSYLWD